MKPITNLNITTTSKTQKKKKKTLKYYNPLVYKNEKKKP